jgi:hypothetical protein
VAGPKDYLWDTHDQVDPGYGLSLSVLTQPGVCNIKFHLVSHQHHPVCRVSCLEYQPLPARDCKFFQAVQPTVGSLNLPVFLS